MSERKNINRGYQKLIVWQWDLLAFKLENGMKKLIESLQYKQADNDWQDSFILKESNGAYGETE